MVKKHDELYNSSVKAALEKGSDISQIAAKFIDDLVDYDISVDEAEEVITTFAEFFDLSVEKNIERFRNLKKDSSQSLWMRFKRILNRYLNGNKINEYDFPPLKMYLFPWLRDKSITLISGKKGIGKSWLVLFIIWSILYGINLGLWVFKNSLPIILFDFENPIKTIQKNYSEITKGLGKPLRPFKIAAIITVPTPKKGSKTKSPPLVMESTNLSINSTGN